MNRFEDRFYNNDTTEKNKDSCYVLNELQYEQDTVVVIKKRRKNYKQLEKKYKY